MAAEKGAGRTVVSDKGGERYDIVATDTLDCAPSQLWAVLSDFERFVDVGLSGMASGFRWLTGGPGLAPATFEFTVADVVLKEEVYELTSDGASDRYRLRYRALEPALGVLEYDAVLDVEPSANGTTLLTAVRSVRMAPGVAPDMLAGMVDAEMQSLADHLGEATR
ncbi:MAG: SRPBCC family protein [Gemmatimonadota bacterium]